MEQKNRLAVFDTEVEKIISKLLRETDEKISKINNSDSVEEIQNTLIEANTLVNLACGDDDDLYEQFRYRLIISNNNQVYIIQGNEIDVEFNLYDEGDDEE